MKGLLVLLVLLSLTPLQAADTDSPSFRLMTYNIHHGEGIDGTIDLERIAKVIRDSRADIVALQEVDRGTTRTAKRDIPAELSKLTGLTAVFSNNYHFGGGEYGNALLTRFPVQRWTNTHFHQLGNVEQRGVLQAELLVHDLPLVVANTHLDAGRTPDERDHSVAQLAAILRAYESKPILLTGDFNATPDSAVYRELLPRFRDAWNGNGKGPGWTIPVENPMRRIDYIWVSKEAPWVVRDIRVLSTKASDHLPVMAEFILGDPAP